MPSTKQIKNPYIKYCNDQDEYCLCLNCRMNRKATCQPCNRCKMGFDAILSRVPTWKINRYRYHWPVIKESCRRFKPLKKSKKSK